jgi:pSer/pThr/pTyr-binding forkhead associated (FHA) protein
MENNYKRTIAGSVGAGVGALLNAQGRKYYILEHKTDSMYHHAGESQKIIVDQVELGRDASCQVRFDESMETVSRKHAAIIRDGESYKLVPMSQTNATLVNGEPISSERVLNSGDEIRLSSRGPVMGFIIPQGTQSSVKNIGLTERMSLFRQQALRPYKQALIALLVVLLAAVGGLVYWNLHQAELNDLRLADAQEQIHETQKELISATQEMESLAQKSETVITNKQDYNEAVYYIKANNIQVYTVPGNRLLVDINVEEESYEFHGGTGFMLNDGRFVTSHRVIEPWMYYRATAYDHDGKVWTFTDIRSAVKSNRYRVVANYTAYSSSGMNFKFTNTDFRIENPFSSRTADDWATMAKRDQLFAVKGLPYDANLSIDLKGGTPVTIIGYPLQRGFKDSQSIAPVHLPNNINVTGLNIDGIIELSSRRHQDGNDGSPVLVNKDGEWVVIGILSHTDDAKHDVVTPIHNTEL